MEAVLLKIKDLIKAKGLTIYKLTELAGLSENTIYNWYNKGSEPTLRALDAICPFLGVSLAYLVSTNDNYTNTFQEMELIKYFRNLSENKREALLGLVKEM